MKNKTLVFFLSFVPGVGHLYLGLMNRGMQLLLSFFGIIFLMNLIDIHQISIFLPVIWFFALFDSLQQHTLIKEGAHEDRSILPWNNINYNHKWIAYGLIVTGIYILLENMFDLVAQYFQVLYRYNVSTFLLSILFIIIGVKLLANAKPKEQKTGGVDIEKP